MNSGIFHEIAVSEKEGRVKYMRDVHYNNTLSLVKQGDHVMIAEDRYERVLMSQDFSRTGI